MESPPSEKHPWPTATLKSRSLADTRPPHVSLHFRDLTLPVSLEAAQTLVAASAIASCISGLPHATSKSSYEEKQKFLARVEWLPVTSRSYVTHSLTHSQTDNVYSIDIYHIIDLRKVGISTITV